MKKRRKDPLGIPNVCFSIAENGSKRAKQQRFERGFDDSETWSLDCTIAQFVLPRLKRYLKVTSDVISISDKERKDINKVIRAMELIVYEINSPEILTEKEYKEVQYGLKVFGKIFQTLWW